MDIKHENGEIRGVFKAEENGVGLGLMTYTWAGDTRFIIDHTEVFPENEGKGVGKEMVMAAVEYARAKLLQKSEMRKDIVIELSYKGFG